MAKPPTPEVTRSRRLSFRAHPGEAGIRTRKVAVAVAAGVDGSMLSTVLERLRQEGAMPRSVGSRLGAFKDAAGSAFEADASLETEPGVLFDALILPDGEEAVEALARDARTLEAVRDQYRHCKPILAIGAGRRLLQAAGVADGVDAGIVQVEGHELARGLDAFVEALGQHRFWERETDPPAV